MRNPVKALRQLPRPDRALFRGDGRWVGVYLTVAAGLVLLAIVALTRTWFSAQHIAQNAQRVANRMHGVHTDTKHLDILYRTDHLVRGIAANTKGLDQKGARVRENAQDIAHDVADVRQHAASIQDRVVAINASVQGINATLRPLVQTVAAIQDDAGSIQQLFASTLDVAHSINKGVAGINIRTLTVHDQVVGIRHDTGNIVALFHDVLTEATGIDCSKFVNGRACPSQQNQPALR